MAEEQRKKKSGFTVKLSETRYRAEAGIQSRKGHESKP